MSPDIIVLVKQVPDIDQVRFNEETGTLDRTSVGGTINPFDLNALEAAIQIKGEVGGMITTISMGPSQAESTLRDTIARGADRAILLTDKRFAGSDTLATSFTLASAIKKLDRFDLIICGEKTVDGDTAQVGAEVAERLGIPHIAYVEGIIDASSKKLIVTSNMGGKSYLISLEFPALVTVTKDVNMPRLPTLGNKLKARKTKIEIWDADDFVDDIQVDKLGLPGSPTRIIKVYTPTAEGRKRVIIKGEAEKVAKEIMGILKRAGLLE